MIGEFYEIVRSRLVCFLLVLTLVVLEEGLCGKFFVDAVLGLSLFEGERSSLAPFSHMSQPTPSTSLLSRAHQ